jgi:molybdate transport system permease protein
VSTEDWSAIRLTLELAAITTVLLVILTIPLAWWLSSSQSRFRDVVATLVNLPLVLPPTVLGFYLLITFGPDGLVGQITQALDIGLLSFTFTGLVIGSMLFSLPFAVQPILHAFESLGKRPVEVAATLRASPMDTFFSVLLPMIRPGILTASVLTFAHTVGEFGVVLMMGGNIPGKTQVVSTQIYTHVESLEFAKAHVLSAVMVLFSFVILLALTRLRRHTGNMMR